MKPQFETHIFKTKDLAEKILKEAHGEAATFYAKHGRKPTLAVVLVGSDPASQIYVGKKSETCKAHGLQALDFKLAPEDGFAKLEALVQ